MNEVTEILARIEQGDQLAAEELLPLVYDELRRLAASKMAFEDPGDTMQATALVHESYLRLVHVGPVQRWQSRAHFFAAAARAMRQILVERARRRNTTKRGGEYRRVELADPVGSTAEQQVELLALDEALTELESHAPDAAKLVELRYFSGLTHQEAASALGIPRRAADRLWALARAWLFRRISQ